MSSFDLWFLGASIAIIWIRIECINDKLNILLNRTKPKYED